MRLLLDTHVLLWALGDPRRLTPSLRALVEDGGNEVLFSAASIWEIAIKAALGRADFAVRPERIVAVAAATGFGELAVSAAAAACVADLPLHHRDPFDRLLVAQAMAAGVGLYTADAALAPYGAVVRVMG